MTHHHEARSRTGKNNGTGSASGNGSEPGSVPAASLEAALVERLRSMDWPAPDPEVRERCLKAILGQMASDVASDPGLATNEGTRRERARRALRSSVEERHQLTRRRADAYRPQQPAPKRPVRLATVL